MNKFQTIRRATVATLLGFAAWGAHAQSYPSRTIQVIVPYSAGGPTDVAARIMSQRLSERLGQSVVVQNLLGAGGIVGSEVAIRAKPDGYTLYFGVNSMAIFPNVRPANNPMPFNVNDFVPIGGVAESAHVVLANKSAGFRTIAEMVAVAKQKPEGVSYGSAGIGGTTHLPLALFAHRAGIKLLHVPYKGAAPAMMDTIAGVVAMSAPGYSGGINEAVKNGSVVPLAVTSAKRLPFMPDVPTLAESGYPDMVFPIWYGLFGPKGLPADIVAKLSAELKAMADEPEYSKKLYAQGNVAGYMPPAQLGQMLADDIKRLGERIKASGMSFQE
ncbi:MAG: tripartite tricarboxylate transporter substrate binding protein [Burkholderiales bacterium]|nr:tripartite tricarboxylate transporter substrate binding protein [Burkholderiales bacterium]